MKLRRIMQFARFNPSDRLEDRYAIIKRLIRCMRYRMMRKRFKERAERFIYPSLRVVVEPKKYPPPIRLGRYRANIPLENEIHELGALKHWANLSLTRFQYKINQAMAKIPPEKLITAYSISFEAYNALLDHQHRSEEEIDPVVLEQEGFVSVDDDSIANDPFMPHYKATTRREANGESEEDVVEDGEEGVVVADDDKTVQIVALKNLKTGKNLRQTKIDDYFKPRQREITT